MATIKSYTDISQSKKLAEILPLESADMYYFRQIDNGYFPPDVEFIYHIPLFKDGKEDFNYDIRCWSLAALLGVLPYPLLSELSNGIWKCVCYPSGICNYVTANSPIDACYEMIIRLHELKML